MKDKYTVRDWMDARTYEFESLEEAQEKFNEIKKDCEGINCDLQLYKVVDEFMSDDLKNMI